MFHTKWHQRHTFLKGLSVISLPKPMSCFILKHCPENRKNPSTKLTRGRRLQGLCFLKLQYWRKLWTPQMCLLPVLWASTHANTWTVSLTASSSPCYRNLCSPRTLETSALNVTQACGFVYNCWEKAPLSEETRYPTQLHPCAEFRLLPESTQTLDSRILKLRHSSFVKAELYKQSHNSLLSLFSFLY